MESVGAYEAKTHLPKLLDRVAKGERITITRHGIPVAILEPAAKDKHADVTGVIKKMRQFRKKNRLNGLSIKSLIEKGRR